MHIDLSNTRLDRFPKDILTKTEITSLNLEFNQIDSVPPDIIQLRQLKELYLSYNRLTSLPKEIFQLPQLETLRLSHNQLSAIPQALGQTSQLRQLDLSHNQLGATPNLSNTPQIEVLYLPNNQIESVSSEDFDDATQLTKLELSNNPLQRIANNAFQHCPLEYLALAYCQLAELPDLCQQQRLAKLHIQGNRIEQICGQRLKLSCLVELIAYCNRLTELNHFDTLSSLRSIDLSSNQLVKLPTGFRSAQKLERLIVSNNQLTTIPENILEHPKVSYASFAHNDLHKLPPLHHKELPKPKPFLDISANPELTRNKKSAGIPKKYDDAYNLKA